ncbi:MAG: recombinase family protein [Eubacteriales bacterium]|nr:recombinase family protein [Eubacteriales bacterium]
MDKVVYYGRVSTEEKDQVLALSRQKEELEEYINSQIDWELVGAYVDEGKSGTSEQGRKQYQKLYDDLESDKFDIVVIKDISRLNRDTLNWYLFVDRLLKNEKKLFFYDEKNYYRPDDALIIGVRALIAAQFSRDLSKKINMAHTQRAKKGRAVTNGKMWGYNQHDGQLTINEEQAEVVRKVFAMYIDGMGFRTIVKEFTRLGIFNQDGNEFSETTLKRMIRNEKYKGVLISNKRHKDFDTKKVNDVPEDQWIVREGAVPPIVSTEIWDQANEILAGKRQVYKDGDKEKMAGYFKGGYVYSGKIKCEACGETYWHQTYKYTTKKGMAEQDVWQCGTYRKFGKYTEDGCGNPQIKTEELDRMVKGVIFDFWNNKDSVIKNALKALDKSLGEDTSLEEIKKCDSEIAKLEKKKENLINMRVNAEITKDEFVMQKEKLEGVIENFRKQTKELEVKSSELVDKKKRLLLIKDFLGDKLKSPEGIDEEIIKHFLIEVLIKKNGEVAITLDGGLTFLCKRDGGENNSQMDIAV